MDLPLEIPNDVGLWLTPKKGSNPMKESSLETLQQKSNRIRALP